MTSDTGIARPRWVFGEYIVYAPDRYVARQIYELVSGQPEPDPPFGFVTLPNGSGNWVKIGKKRPAQE